MMFNLIRLFIKSKITVIFSFLCLGSLSAQTPISYSFIDTVDLPKNEIYNRIIEALVLTYNSAKDVIELQDKELGKMIIKAKLRVPYRNGFGQVIGHDMVDYDCKIDIKDNKYRITFSDFNHRCTSADLLNCTSYGYITDVKPKGFFYTKKYYKEIRDAIDVTVNTIVKGIREHTKPTPSSDGF